MLIAAIIVTITDSRILFVLTASCRFVLIIKRFSPVNSAFSAFGGTLNSDIGEAGGLHGGADSSVVLRPGRSDEYRQRMAREMQIAAGVRSPAAPLSASN